MATFTANSTTRNGVTLHLRADVNGGTVTITPTLSATVPIYEETNSCSWSGANSGSYSGPCIRIGSSSAGRTASHAALKINSGGATSFTFNVGQTTSPQNKSVTFSLSGIDYAGATLTATVNFTIGALAPGAVSGVSATDPLLISGQWGSTITWSLPAGATGVNLYRWDIVSGTYGRIAQLGAVSSYVDTTLQGDMRNRYRVHATNSGGEGPGVESNYVHTPAAAPTGLTAARSGTSITGSFINQSRLNPAFEIQDTTDDGDTWTTVSTIGRANHAVGAKITYTVSGLNAALPHRIRVRAIGEHPAPNGTPSEWTPPSTTVVIITKPNPPTGLTSGVVAWESALTLSAKPDGTVLPDGSTLDAFEWRHRAQGASSWTTVANADPDTLTTTVSGYPSNSSVEHQVRVKGAHADWSEWSPVALVTLSARPVSSFTSPTDGGILQGDTLTIAVSGHDPDGGNITAARYWLTDADGRYLATVVETTSKLNGWTFPNKLADGQQVVAWVQHRETHGIWSTPVSLDRTVEYIGPAGLDVTTRWDRDHALLIFEWESLVDPSKPAPVAVDVYALQNGQRVELATGLSTMGAWPLRLAPLVDTVYMLAIRSALPSTTWQTVVVAADPMLVGQFVINGGPGYSITAIGSYDVEFSRNGGRERVVQDGWANSPYGRETVREALTDERQMSFATFDHIDSAEDFAVVQAQPHALWYRDPTGASWACSMTKPSRTLSKRSTKVTVSFTITRIGGGPAFDEAIEASLVTADTIYADLIPDA